MSHVFGPSVTGFYRVSKKVSDVIPVLRLTPIGTQPSAVSVFLSVAKCGDPPMSWGVMTPHFSRQRGTGGHNFGIIH